jgi:hypothetical protein
MHMPQAMVRSKSGDPASITGVQREREQLEEELRQLRAAVEIYAEIARRLRPASAGQAPAQHPPLAA